MPQTAAIIFSRSPVPNRDFHPFVKAMLKLFLTAGRACSSSRQTLHGVNALAGSSTFSSIVAMTLIIIARMRSGVSNASLLKAFLAWLRASLNLSFASDNKSLLDSSKSISGKLASLLARDTALASVEAEDCKLADCTVVAAAAAACSVTFFSGSFTPLFALSNTSNKIAIPTLKALILESRSLRANPSSFLLIWSISRTIKLRNFSSVTSPSFSFSATVSLALLINRPIVALKTAVAIEVMLNFSTKDRIRSRISEF